MNYCFFASCAPVMSHLIAHCPALCRTARPYAALPGFSANCPAQRLSGSRLTPMRKPGAPFQARRTFPAFLFRLLLLPSYQGFCRMLSPGVFSGYMAIYIVTYLCSVFRTAPGPAYSSFTMPSSFSPRPASYRSAPKISARVKSLRRHLKS